MTVEDLKPSSTLDADALAPRGLDHVVLRIADLERSLRFYRDALGLEIERRLDEQGLVQLRAGTALIDLVPIDSPLGRAGGGAPDANARNLDHFALSLARFDEASLRALFARHAIPASETAERYGAEGFGPSIYLTDPDGNTVELKGPPTRRTDAAGGPRTHSGGLDLDATKRAVLAAAQEMDRAGLTEGTAGNLSARTRTGQIVLTPTAMRYAEVTVDDLVITDLDGRVLSGTRPPTTEIALHIACLRRHRDIAAVVHTHPVHATMFAVSQRPIPCAIEELELYVGATSRSPPITEPGRKRSAPRWPICSTIAQRCSWRITGSSSWRAHPPRPSTSRSSWSGRHGSWRGRSGSGHPSRFRNRFARNSARPISSGDGVRESNGKVRHGTISRSPAARSALVGPRSHP